MKILAGIVVYKPDIKRLNENIAAVRQQVEEIVFFVNGQETYEQIQDLQDITLIKSLKNVGIASALKGIMQYAMDHEFDWVLTLDQDSVCMEGVVQEYLKYTDLPQVGMMTCNIVDRNFKNDSGFRDGQQYQEIKACITSGAFTSVKAYRYTDGYDEKMFIDAVDWDMCYNLKRYGYKIYRINYDGLLHEVGHGKNVKLFGKKYITYGESPLRNYYSARNTLYLAKKYPEYMSIVMTLIRELRAQLLILLYEDQKFKKLTARWRGILEYKKIVKKGTI